MIPIETYFHARHDEIVENMRDKRHAMSDGYRLDTTFEFYVSAMYAYLLHFDSLQIRTLRDLFIEMYRYEHHFDSNSDYDLFIETEKAFECLEVIPKRD